MKNRNGFTLIEILVVVSILLILATLSIAVFNAGKSSDKMRSGARVAQSSFLGAKDRALHAKDLRGVRLTRDLTNPNLLNGFVYLQPLPTQTAGNTAGNNPNDFAIWRPVSDATQIVLTGMDGLTFLDQDTTGVIWPPGGTVSVRIPAMTGQWFALKQQQNMPPYWVTPDPTNAPDPMHNAANGTNRFWLYLQTGYPGGSTGNPAVNKTDPGASCDVQLGNDVLPFHQPITLPSGCVIDLAYSNSTVKILAGYSGVAVPNPLPNIDVMFSPRGNVTGTVSALGMLCFTLRDIRDATRKIDPADPTVQGDCLILGVTPQTGLVTTFDVDLTDNLTNATGLPGPDGLADNIFNFAQRGQSAGH